MSIAKKLKDWQIISDTKDGLFWEKLREYFVETIVEMSDIETLSDDPMEIERRKAVIAFVRRLLRDIDRSEEKYKELNEQLKDIKREELLEKKIPEDDISGEMF